MTNRECWGPASLRAWVAAIISVVAISLPPNLSVAQFCGDGFADPGEACDDGNNILYDACVNCQPASCGDFYVYEGIEDCDFGSFSAPGDGCPGCVNAVPPNDDCASARVIPPLTPSSPSTALRNGGVLATTNIDDPTHSCTSEQDYGTIWFSYTSSHTGGLSVSAGSLDFTTEYAIVSVIDGACTGQETHCSDVGALAVAVEAGHSYLIELSFPVDPSPNYYISLSGIFCGDGTMSGSEACDDGNTTNDDGCDDHCEIECGNGQVDGAEACDDGNASNTDACTNACVPAACGDGFVESGTEECDDGNLLDGDGCEADCASPPPELGESCDTATPLVVPSLGSIDLAEGFDDPSDPPLSCNGDMIAHHSKWFTYTATFSGPLIFAGQAPFGVGIVVSSYSGSCAVPTEIECFSNAFGLAPTSTDVVEGETYWFSVAATTTTYGVTNIHATRAPYCGDGSLGSEEACDDGNEIDGDDCSNTCTLPVCGDGILQRSTEDCDDANANELDGCLSDCTAVCGDTLVVGSEDCDDGNAIDGDGCESDCRFPCPSSLCSCLRGAGSYATVAGKTVLAKTGKYTAEGESDFLDVQIYGDVCAPTAKFSAKEVENTVEGDIILSKPSTKVVGKFSGLKIEGVIEPGTFVDGDLLTAGGVIKPNLVEVDGVTSTAGTDLRIGRCQQAINSLQLASTDLKNLPATQTIPFIRVDDGDVYTINAGPGVNVINVGSIEILSGRDEDNFPLGSELLISMAPDTDSVIINVALGLKVETDGLISVDGPADAVIINMKHEKPSVKLSVGAQVAPVLLVPTGAVKLPIYGYLSNVYSGDKLSIVGAVVEDVLECE